MYLGTTFLILFYVGNNGSLPKNGSALWFIGSTWLLLTIGAFSFIDAKNASSHSLVLSGIYLIFVGCVSAAFATRFAKPEAFSSFLYSALLFPSAAAGINFTYSGAIELLRNTKTHTPYKNPQWGPQQLIKIGFITLYAGLIFSGIAMWLINDPVLQKFGEQAPLFLCATFGLNMITQGVIERARTSHETTPQA